MVVPIKYWHVDEHYPTFKWKKFLYILVFIIMYQVGTVNIYKIYIYLSDFENEGY